MLPEPTPATRLCLFDPETVSGDDGGVTVRQIIEDYLRYLELRRQADDFSADALDNARRDLRRFAAFQPKLDAPPWGDRSVAECRQSDLTAFLLGNPQWKSNATKRRVLSILLACFHWAEEDEELIQRSPYRRPKKLKLPIKPRRNATAGEYITLMRSDSRELRRALYFLWNFGARTKEMREVLVPMIDWQNHVIDYGAHHKTWKVTGKPRIIGMGEPRFARWLKNVCRQRAKDGVRNVFVNCDGTPWDRHSFARHLRRWAQRLGLDEAVVERVSGYCLRHTYITDADEGGTGSKQIADQAGNSEAMVAHYSKARGNKKHLRNVAEQIATRRKDSRRKAAAGSRRQRDNPKQPLLFPEPEE